MMFLALFCLLFVQGLASRDDDSEKFNGCNDLLTGEAGDSVGGLPEPEEILARCPHTKKYIDCRIAYYQPEFDSLYNLGDYFVNKEFLDQICDEDSTLHKAYKKHLPCFKGLSDEWNECLASAALVVQDYKKSSYAVQDSDIVAWEDHDMESYRAFAETSCLINVHAFNCLGHKLEDICEEGSLRTYIELFEGTRFANHFCGKDENPFLKAFVHFLEKDGDISESVVIRMLFEIEDK